MQSRISILRKNTVRFTYTGLPGDAEALDKLRGMAAEAISDFIGSQVDNAQSDDESFIIEFEIDFAPKF